MSDNSVPCSTSEDDGPLLYEWQIHEGVRRLITRLEGIVADPRSLASLDQEEDRVVAHVLLDYMARGKHEELVRKYRQLYIAAIKAVEDSNIKQKRKGDCHRKVLGIDGRLSKTVKLAKDAEELRAWADETSGGREEPSLLPTWAAPQHAVPPSATKRERRAESSRVAKELGVTTKALHQAERRASKKP